MKYVAVTKTDNDIIINGDMCVTSMEELYKALVDHDCTELEVTKDFADTHFTYTSLCDFMENCTLIAPDKRVYVEGMSYNDLSKEIANLRSYRDISELIFAMESNPTKFMSCIHELCRRYMDTQDSEMRSANQIASLQMRIKDLEDDLSMKDDELESVHHTLNETRASLKALVNRVNFRYEKTVNPDKMFLSDFNNYTHILYVKEITRVHYTDTLLYYLQEILKTLYEVPVRFVCIEPFYAYDRARLYPHCQPHWQLSYHDVYSGDIFMAGYQPHLMQDILQNASHVQYLIILDRCGYMVPHVQGSNVSYLYTASDLKDVPEDISRDSVISYSEQTLYIPYLDNFDSMSLEQRIQEYSSFTVMQHMITLLEGTKF